MNILLITPPLTQLNTPYPATQVLKGFLQSKGYKVHQFDLGIELVNSIFTTDNLRKIFNSVEQNFENKKIPSQVRFFLNNRLQYLSTVDSVMRFLRNQDPTLSNRICSGNFLPEGPRFKNISDTEWAFGALGTLDHAKYLATLYIEDLTDFIRENVCEYFDLFRYGEKLCLYMPSFENLDKALRTPANFIDKLMLTIMDVKFKSSKANVVGFTIPFPGNLYAALKCSQFIKITDPDCKIVLGGGYINTELRELNDPRVFNFCDAVLLDEGEPAFLKLLEYYENKIGREELVKTFLKEKDGAVVMYGKDSDFSIPFSEKSIPDYSELPLHKYLSMIEITNPMHKLWSDGRWNKLTLAHGCYWAKCAFCDTSLPYISKYEACTARQIADSMADIIKQTGQTGFHFTDEAAPPKIVRELSEELLERKLTASWWTNIRFEKAYTQELCFLMANAGCIAVSGGIEVASDRILKLINKGVTIEQAAISCFNLTQNGIMVHAYLMYGFPTETLQETIDSLEIVRQFFEEGLIQSAFWHRYAMTVHSPSGKNPEHYGAQIVAHEKGTFANNEIPFTDNQQLDLEPIGEGLRKATFNYLHGNCLDWNVKKWFSVKVPDTTIPPDYIAGII